MFKAISVVIKLTFFAGLVLTLGSLITFNGRSMSQWVDDRVELVRHNEVGRRLKNWIEVLLRDVGIGEKKRVQAITGKPSNHDSLLASEQQKLRALLNELNFNDSGKK